jgi:hypothetical protein
VQLLRLFYLPLACLGLQMQLLIAFKLPCGLACQVASDPNTDRNILGSGDGEG